MTDANDGIPVKTVVRRITCPDPHCDRVVAVQTAKGGKGWFCCDGAHDPQGLGCGARGLISSRTMRQFRADYLEAQTDDEDSDRRPGPDLFSD